MPAYQLAQVNIAKMRGPIDSAVMAPFVALLDEINALGERSPGFVWRLKDDSDHATAIRVYEDESILINLSVWENPEALRQFVYFSVHVDAFRRRAEWFEKLATPTLALWWTPVGVYPSALEAKERLEHLIAHGPTPRAFTFKKQFTVEEALVQGSPI